ncbi:MAG: nicotinamide mononucleotide transporter [Ruminococcaceae bacterium]|nr:nicotinamide mononucleotide transporter [Oscillospiraceae bacterium]
MKVRKIKFNEILAIIATLLLIAGHIIFKPEWYVVFPLYISMIVKFLNSNVSRYAFLLGGINCIFHGIASIALTLYSTAACAILLLLPLQIITFINWSKHTQDGVTEIKRFSNKGRVLLFGVLLAGWAILYFIFSFLNSSYIFLDNTATVLSVAAIVLSLLRYSEGFLLSLAEVVVNVILFIQVTVKDPDEPAAPIWLVFYIYSVICVIIGFVKMNKRSTEAMKKVSEDMKEIHN